MQLFIFICIFPRTNLSLKLLLYHCMISVMIPPFFILATHAQVDTIIKLNESTEVKSTQEQLEEAFEEQV